jgi:hypothetical protein
VAIATTAYQRQDDNTTDRRTCIPMFEGDRGTTTCAYCGNWLKLTRYQSIEYGCVMQRCPDADCPGHDEQQLAI